MPLRPVWSALDVLDPLRIHHLDIRKGEALADQEVQVEISEETMLRGYGVDLMHRGAAHDKKERSKKLVSGPLST